ANPTPPPFTAHSTTLPRYREPTTIVPTLLVSALPRPPLPYHSDGNCRHPEYSPGGESLGPRLPPEASLHRGKNAKRLKRAGLRRFPGKGGLGRHRPCFLPPATRTKSTRKPGSFRRPLVNQPSNTICFSKGDNREAATQPAHPQPFRPPVRSPRRPEYA